MKSKNKILLVHRVLILLITILPTLIANEVIGQIITIMATAIWLFLPELFRIEQRILDR
jgi:type III secretory pathway component EscS